MFECEKCKKCFNFECDYERHISMSSNCEILSIKSSYECDCCHKAYANKGSLSRHIKTYAGKCINTVEIQRENALLKKQIKAEIISELKKGKFLSITNNVINNINNTTTNNVNTNINNINNLLFVKPGEETVQHITKDVILKLLNMPSFTKICVDLMQDAYFNRKVPKNHNWCLVYPQNEKAAVVFDYNVNKFSRESTSKIINEKFENLMNLLTPVLLEIIEEEDKTGFLNERQKRNLFRIKHFCNVDELSNESSEIYESIHKLAYNEREIPMKTWDESGLKGNHLSLKFK